MAYTYKIVNGVKIALTSGDQTKLTAKDAANFQPGQLPPGPGLLLAPRTAPLAATTSADKVANMAAAYGLTVAELKAELCG